MTATPTMAGEMVVHDDAQALARHVADWLAARIAQAAAPMRIALSGGSTPKAMLALLGGPDYAGKIDWSHVHLFWGDERFVPPDHPDSNYGMTRERLLSHISIPPENVHPIPSDGAADDAALRYEQTLKRDYGADALDPARMLFDVNFLGLGDDGHTASLIPGQPVLQERTRWAAAVTGGRPETRITLTYPVLDSAKTIAFLVSGKGKTDILHRVRGGDTSVPAGGLHPGGELLWFVDRDAAG